jgi:hypothetical protein
VSAQPRRDREDARGDRRIVELMEVESSESDVDWQIV